MIEGISIHAPAKGATNCSHKGFTCGKISIHAPAKGATAPSRISRPHHGHFNPRSREGSDSFGGVVFLAIKEISIHAPAKGATIQTEFARDVGEFQSTLPRRERLKACYRLAFVHEFQSTLPRRERHKCVYSVYNIHIISIHAPAKGAT